MGRVHVLHRRQRVELPVEEAFAFYGDAHNLERITPPWLGFEVTTPGPIEMGVGTLIEYRLRLHRVPVRWRTRITAWEPPRRFVDTQVRGPYSLWEHTHTFEEGRARGDDDRGPRALCDPLRTDRRAGRPVPRAARPAADIRLPPRRRRPGDGPLFSVAPAAC